MIDMSPVTTILTQATTAIQGCLVIFALLAAIVGVLMKTGKVFNEQWSQKSNECFIAIIGAAIAHQIAPNVIQALFG